MKKTILLVLIVMISAILLIPKTAMAEDASKDAQLKFLQDNTKTMFLTKRVELFVKRLKALNFRTNMLSKKILEKAQKIEESGSKNKKLTVLVNNLVAGQTNLSASNQELEKLILDLSKDNLIDKSDIKEISKKIATYKLEIGKIMKLNKDIIAILKVETKIKIIPAN